MVDADRWANHRLCCDCDRSFVEYRAFKAKPRLVRCAPYAAKLHLRKQRAARDAELDQAVIGGRLH